MPGLLGYDPTNAALINLGAGMVRGDFGGGLLGASQAYQTAQEQALKQQLGQANIADIQQQMELRKAQVDALNRKNNLLSVFLNGGSPGGSAGSPGVPSQPAMPGQLGSGSFGAISPPAGQPAIPPVQSGGQGGFVSRLNPDTLAALKLGADADLTDIYKLTQPDWKVDGGYRWNARDPSNTSGFLPQVKTSENGQTTVLMPDGRGGVRVGAPAGAIDTYSNYRNADEAAKAGQDLVKIVGPDGAERYITRAQAVRASQPTPPAQPPASPVVTGPADADRYAILTQELAKARTAGNAGDVAALEREIARLPASARTVPSPSGLTAGPLQASPTTAQAAAAAAEKERQTQITKDVTELRKSIVNADFVAPTNIAKMQKIGQLLADVDGGRFTPNGTEVASALNSLGIKIDKNLGNKQAAAAMANEMALQLRSPQGGAGMPGALSDKDREFLASMTPNQAQSLEGRNQVIGAYVAVQKRNQQVAQFARNYEKKYGRLDNGFFDQMAAWSAAHPLFGGK